MLQIDNHTFDDDLLTGGWVIDAGCRGFTFAHELLIRDCNVLALDIENFQVPNFNYLSSNGKLIFKHAALSHKSGEIEAHFFGNGTGNFLKGINGEPGNTEDRPCETKSVKCITLNDIYNEIGTNIDLLKLDIEGAEYEILENLEPIPKQITVEFHEHCHADLHNKYIDKILDHLCKHYHLNLYIREWPRYKFMDCLFIRKDLV